MNYRGFSIVKTLSLFCLWNLFGNFKFFWDFSSILPSFCRFFEFCSIFSICSRVDLNLVEFWANLSIFDDFFWTFRGIFMIFLIFRRLFSIFRRFSRFFRVLIDFRGVSEFRSTYWIVAKCMRSSPPISANKFLECEYFFSWTNVGREPTKDKTIKKIVD